MTPIYHQPAHLLYEKLVSGEMTCVSLVKIYLDRIEAVGGKNGVNAIAEIDETALEQARALDMNPDARALPLFGLPTIASALNIAVNLFGGEILMEMLTEPDNASADLTTINNLLCELH
ncbi:MAG: hypothetical protein IJO53_00215, partial [Clostridia bacterium]|nr:hypothetical protein [Clostridia bacterium]